MATIINAMKNFVEKNNSGLMLLDQTTGSGKTYFSIKFANEYLQKHQNQRIIFTVNTKINIPEQEIKKYPYLQEHYHKLLSIDDSLYEIARKPGQFIDSSSETIIKSKIKDADLKIKFETCVKSINNAISKYGKTISDSKATEEVREFFKEKTKKEVQTLNQIIKTILQEIYKDENKRINAVLHNKEWEFARALFSGIGIFDKNNQFFTMTIDKLIRNIDTIVGESGLIFENHKILKPKILEDVKYLFFIDEIDLASKTMSALKYERAAENNIDLLMLVKKICNINFKSIPFDIKDADKKEKLKDFELSVNEYKKKYPDIYDYCIEMNDCGVIYRDYITRIINKKEEQYFAINFDKNKNKISIENDLEATSDQLKELIEDSIILINASVEFIKNIYAKYTENKNNYFEYLYLKENKTYQLLTEDDGLASILNCLRITDFATGKNEDPLFIFYKQKIKNTQPKTSSASILKSSDPTNYLSTGFELFQVVKNTWNVETDEIKCYSYQSSIENDLIGLAKYYNIIGMSATCRFDTIINNFSIPYLKEQLGAKFYEIPEREKEAIKAEYDNYNDYSNVKFETKVIKNSRQESINGIFNEIFKGIKINPELSEEIKTDMNKINNTYDLKETLKIAKAYKEALENGIIQMIFLSTRGFNESKENARIKLIKESVTAISNHFGITENVLYFLDSNKIKVEKRDIEARVQASLGKPILICSSYLSIGAGQNLQYFVPYEKLNEVIPTNKDAAQKIKEAKLMSKEEYEKEIKSWNFSYTPNLPTIDFPAIYLNEPKQIIPSPNKDIKTMIEQIDKTKRLYYSGSINEKTENEMIGTYVKKPTSPLINDKFDVKVQKMAIVTQGAGRIQRCHIKFPKTIFFIDEEMINGYPWKDINYTLSSNIFIDSIKKVNKEKSREDRKKERNLAKLTNKNNNGRRFIEEIVSKLWNSTEKEFAIELYKELSSFIISNPTMVTEPVLCYKSKIDGKYYEINLVKAGLYFKFEKGINGYSYEIDKNTDITSIMPLNEDESDLEVSARNACLDFFCSKSNVKTALEKAGVILSNNSFMEGTYILSPAAFINIYKGRIGEIVLREILNEFGVELEELNDDIYELFDFKVKGKNIFIDAKLHKENSWENIVLEPQNDKEIIKKAKRIGTNPRIIIINIYKSNTTIDKREVTGNIIKINQIYNKQFQELIEKEINNEY